MARSSSNFGSHYLQAVILRRDDISDFDSYPYSLPIINSLDYLPLHPKVTYLIGENGAGKSTLLEAIAVAAGFNAEGGSRNFNFSTRSSHSSLSDHITLKRGVARPRDGYFLRAESFFTVATEIETRDPEIIRFYGGKSLHEQSHGESFLALFQNRFLGNGLYLLDEPEAALSPMRQMSMLARMHELIHENSQFIIATHSPIMMAYPDSQILLCSADGIQEVAFEDTEHYFVTREFITNRERMLKHLLTDLD